jgi:NTP pyrophosphatase (non-canonical NTP hydrolase)
MDDIQMEVFDWAEKTFPDSTIESKLAHLKEEADELSEAITEGKDIEDILEEVADIVLIAMHAAESSNRMLVSHIRRKFLICQTRTWGEPDENGVVRHTSEGHDEVL